jgi:hypothetical protein
MARTEAAKGAGPIDDSNKIRLDPNGVVPAGRTANDPRVPGPTPVNGDPRALFPPTKKIPAAEQSGLDLALLGRKGGGNSGR